MLPSGAGPALARDSGPACSLLGGFGVTSVLRYFTATAFAVCAAFLSQFSSHLQEMDFDELFQFMQQVPTEDWGETEIEMLLSHAFVLQNLFGGSDAHLTSSNGGVVAPNM